MESKYFRPALALGFAIAGVLMIWQVVTDYQVHNASASFLACSFAVGVAATVCMVTVWFWVPKVPGLARLLALSKPTPPIGLVLLPVAVAMVLPTLLLHLFFSTADLSSEAQRAIKYQAQGMIFLGLLFLTFVAVLAGKWLNRAKASPLITNH
jgi:hypothetical protein